MKIYGKNCINEALRAKAKLEKVFLLDTNQKKDVNIIDQLNKNSIPYEIVNKQKMEKLFGNNTQGYAAFREEYHILVEEDLNNFKDASRILLLDGIMDPHNLGAILRTVDAFGIDLVILPKNRSVSVTEVAAHVSTGAIEHTNIMYVNSLLTICNRLKEMGFWICGTDAKGTVLSTDIDKNLKLAVITGSEGFGMSKTLVNASDFLITIPMVGYVNSLNASDYLITIPMVGHVNSLNASVSAAIVMHDLMKKGE